MSIHPLRRGSVLIAGVLATICVVAIAGCRDDAGSLTDLVVVQYRCNPDEDHDIARVYGMVRNTGEKRTPPADIVATLRGQSGTLKGQDRTELAPLAAGEEREFALEFTSHGKTSRVDIQIIGRGETLPGDDDDESASGASNDADSDSGDDSDG